MNLYKSDLSCAQRCCQRVTSNHGCVRFLHVCSTKEHSQVLTSSLKSLEKREGVLQDKLGSLENQHVQDASRLRMQLDQAQAHTHTLQKEVHTSGSQQQLQ